MATNGVFYILLRKSALAVAVCAVLVMLCYFCVDRPVAFYVHEHELNKYSILKWLTYPPPVIQSWSPLIIAALLVRRAWGPLSRFETTLLTAAFAIIVADQFRESLSFVFGRYWPDTWINNNPSLLKDGSYGFLCFQGTEEYGSFPSGHMARTLAAVVVFWQAFPKTRSLCAAAAMLVAAGLIGMNFHFVGDVWAGSFVGALVGAYATALAGLNKNASIVA